MSTALVQGVAFMGQGLLLLPAAALVLVAVLIAPALLAIAAPLAAAYGVLLWWIGSRIATGRLRSGQPELLAALSAERAARAARPAPIIYSSHE